MSFVCTYSGVLIHEYPWFFFLCYVFFTSKATRVNRSSSKCSALCVLETIQDFITGVEGFVETGRGASTDTLSN